MLTIEKERARVQAPGMLLQLMEPLASVELMAMMAANPLLRLVERGDKVPVLVLPGFSTDDSSTVMLRSQLRAWGYWAHGWRSGKNLGPTPEAFAAARLRLDALYEQHHRPVVLIGQSAGGLLARYLARQAPERVRMVITLGSPIQMRAGDSSSAEALTRSLEAKYDREFRRLADFERGPLPVPATAVYTRTDGIVRWHVCLDIVDECHENVEVRGTHSGLAINPAALLVVADRLRLPFDEWRPFRAPLPLRHLYPPAASWTSSRSSHRPPGTRTRQSMGREGAESVMPARTSTNAESRHSA